MFETMLSCVRRTPLGSPVLPLEKITVARSSGRTLKRTSMDAGESQALRYAPSRSSTEGFAAASSTRIARPGTSSFTFSRNTLEVTTVLIEHARAHDEIPSLDNL